MQSEHHRHGSEFDTSPRPEELSFVGLYKPQKKDVAAQMAAYRERVGLPHPSEAPLRLYQYKPSDTGRKTIGLLLMHKQTSKYWVESRARCGCVHRYEVSDSLARHWQSQGDLILGLEERVPVSNGD